MAAASIYPFTGREVRGRALDEALFRSQLSRLKTLLEAERRYWMETGEGIEEQSEEFVKELLQIGKRSVSEELVKEFETILAEADKLYDEIEKSTIAGR